MGEKLQVGPFNRGLKNDRTAFNIDNDSFPTLINAYQWRGRVKRKRGTASLVRLKRYFNSTSTAYNSGTTTVTLDGSGTGNIITGFTVLSSQTNASLVPGTVTITGAFNTYTDPAMDGNLSPSGSINYASGSITISAEAGQSVSVTYFYYPDLPVMGLEDLILNSSTFPRTMGFDTTYSYIITNNIPFNAFDVSYYKNPSSGTYTGYTQKTTWTPTTWNGGNYQQFWTVNYQGALWATNGVESDFSSASTTIGMQFKNITGVSIITAGNGTTIPAVADLTIVSHGLVQGDFIFVNEVNGITGINFETGYVTSADPQAANTVRVTFRTAVLGGAYTSGGIAQYLTNRSDATKDVIRWYDGDPVNGSNPPVFNTGHGWVNFMPPLSQSSFSISDLPAKQYYLVGCKMIRAFKDRLLFIGAVVQSSDGSPIYLPDTVVFSQNGTPYYTATFIGTSTSAVTSPATVYTPILVPDNQTATPNAYFGDSTGFGGFIQAGYQMAINTSSSNEDVLILGFDTLQSRFVYTGNDIIPFNFYIINSEYGSSSTFSEVNMDDGVLTRGSRGYVITGQSQCKRFDLEIPDAVYQINLKNNGQERFCSQRDFENEWIYFTFPGLVPNATFPNTTLQFNYRDNSWAVFYESYTTYGQFRQSDGYTWSTIGSKEPNFTWDDWNSPWNSGITSVNNPQVIAGNQQGFVFIRDTTITSETSSLIIKSISSSTITSPGHCLRVGDFIYITGAIGTISSQVNGNVFQVTILSEDTFSVDPPLTSGTYLGGGLITRMYIPFIQTKQFPLAWDMARKTRIGTQQYLLTKTDDAQISLLIYLSQDGSNPYNSGPVIPDESSINNGLIYSTVLYTCPESTNLGLTPANTNLQMPTATAQSQIWHRVNTSLIGDTIQLGFTLSEAQMKELDDEGNFISQEAEIELHGFVLDASPSQMLS